MAWPTLTIEISILSDSVKSLVQADLVTPAPWVDITAYVLRWGYSRGRQRQLDRAEAGTGYLELDNADGRFDPENASSPYAAITSLWARPGKHVRVRATHGGVTYDLLYMFVVDWSPTELSRSGDPVVRLGLADHIAWFAQSRNNISTTDGVPVWSAINELLLANDVASSMINLDNESTSPPVSAISETSSNVWSATQSLADTGGDGALLYIDGQGRYTFHDHKRRYGMERSLVAQAVFDNDVTAITGGALPFIKATYTRDVVGLYARSDVSASGLASQTTTDTDLSSRYYTRAISKSTRHKFTTGALSLSRRIIARSEASWADHHLAQHTDVTIDAASDSNALWRAALRLEISDLIIVTERLYPNGRTRTIPSFIEGMTVDVDHNRRSWQATYRLSRALSAFHTVITGKGTVFPSSPSVGDLFYRTDLGFLCYYDGARWLTAHEYEAVSSDLGSFVYSASRDTQFGRLRTDYAINITRVSISYYINGANNGSNYYTFTVRAVDNTYSSYSTVYTHNTSAAGSNVWAASEGSASNPRPSSNSMFSVLVSTTGAPGGLYLFVGVFYRLILS